MPSRGSVGRVPRVLGSRVGDASGPTLVAVGGLHGNEPAGILALERLLGKLSEEGGVAAGELLALSGNRAALERGRRFVDLDLNRLWGMERAGTPANRREGRVMAVEEVEQRDLHQEIEGAAARARGRVHVIDIHSMSASGRPFAVGGSKRPHPGPGLPVPLVVGLDALVEGTLIGHLDRRGFRNVVFECGRHDDPRAVDRAEAALWLSLSALGMLPAVDGRRNGAGRIAEEVRRARAALAADAADVPALLEMRHRHPLATADGFRMNPGFENLQRVRRGQVLARDARGEIRAVENAHILMPLYQDQGSDGFFLACAPEGSG